MKPYYQSPFGKLFNGVCRNVLRALPAETIHCCVTSPPYWGQRNYGLPPTLWGGDEDCDHIWASSLGPSTKNATQGSTETDKWPALVQSQGHPTRGSRGISGTGGNLHPRLADAGEGAGSGTAGQFCSLCGTWRGALGLEPDIAMFVEHLVDIFAEVRRVLHPSGLVWVNLGDVHNARSSAKLKSKDLCLAPERLVVALQENGWWVRHVVPWIKSSPMPGSQHDRFTTAHEKVYMLSKAEKYFFDMEPVRRPNKEGHWRQTHPERQGSRSAAPGWATEAAQKAIPGRQALVTEGTTNNPSGRAPRTSDWWFDALDEQIGYLTHLKSLRRRSHKGLAFTPDGNPMGLILTAGGTKYEYCAACKTLFVGSELKAIKKTEVGGKKIKTCPCGATDDWAAHFAVFPRELIEDIIRCSTSDVGCCPECKEPWVRVVERGHSEHHCRPGCGCREAEGEMQNWKPGWAGYGGYQNTAQATDKFRPGCKCGKQTDCQTCGGKGKIPSAEPDDKQSARRKWKLCPDCLGAGWPPAEWGATEPCVILDPFAGTGTTARVAVELGRHWMGIDLSDAYCELAAALIGREEYGIPATTPV